VTRRLPTRARTRAFVVATLLLAIHQGPLVAEFPRPSGYVNDFASVLTEDDRVYLETFLQAVERDTTAKVVVATVTSLEGLTIEEYASRLFAYWGIGERTRDNGILLLVAPAERRVRIEVGYGLEGILPDGLAGEIIRTAIVPEFQRGNLRRGIGRGQCPPDRHSPFHRCRDVATVAGRSHATRVTHHRTRVHEGEVRLLDPYASRGHLPRYWERRAECLDHGWSVQSLD
jgi:TPM domain